MRKRFSVIFILMAFLLSINFLLTDKISVQAQDNQLNISSKSAYMIDADSGTVIFKQNELKRLPIASMCKIMTLLICFENLDNDVFALTDKVIVSENAQSMGGSQVFLEKNGEYLISDLIKSIVVASANDACVAMAERISGSENMFVKQMNERAHELNMTNTVFANCTGLPQETQYSCAKDVATMFNQLIKHTEYFNFSKIWMDTIPHKNDRYTGISNTNKLIRFYSGCDSGKTGYTSEAGHCLTASAKRDNMRLITVIISAPDSKTRFRNASEMFNYGFNNYTNKLIIDKNKPLNVDVKVKGGKKDKIAAVAEKNIYLFSKTSEKRSCEFDFIPTEHIKAPIKKGEKIGTIKIFEKGKQIDFVNVLANENIEKETYFDVVRNIGKNWAII